jgi:obg-like ATPase 1
LLTVLPCPILACTFRYADLKELGSENAAKAAGKYRQQGKEYVVGDGDIIYFKFNGGLQSRSNFI